MDQAAITDMLRKAFQAGYECPLELMEQEIQRILTESMPVAAPSTDRHEVFQRTMKAMANSMRKQMK